MKKTSPIVLFPALLIFFISCNSNESGSFPMGKKYWTPEDYHDVNSELTNLKYNEKELPNLDNPKTAPVFRKIVDTTNFSVVATDEQLGIKHRSDFMNKMFNEYRDLVSAYSIIDRKDKYQYPVEFVQILKYGLALQVYYIKTGNADIIKDADDPHAANVVNVLRTNQEVLIKNYDLYLDYINYEDRFTESALTSYSDGISNFFPRLINDILPDADYSEMQNKINNMLKKSKNQFISSQLQNIQNIIKNKTQSKAG